ncbi:hypothetical protein [Halococcoides cellulosivorans]|uniref:Uncharacterized protein n=1 Tax=Halococcoides cellulosivorans TaxID=1679096 RepID=A0A2R4WZV4_9EURY|nr:hypothetical protein [Halococcoides cellulosivorans]AWB27059.1 hypothetical protein HARCEL1_04730 [Halococcoides cellulosivorans]
MARKICEGFQAHDRRNREAAIDAFAAVDRYQFDHLDAATAEQAATAYVDALWAKDSVEDTIAGETVDPDALVDADWTPVERAFQRRAEVAGIDSAYAELSTIAWRNHKIGGDYWTPMMRAQAHEVQTALQAPYPDKPRHGQSGFGPTATRYLLAVELHDMRSDHHWRLAHDVMVGYYDRILRSHGV